MTLPPPTAPHAAVLPSTDLLCLKAAAAPKLGPRASGQVHYELLTDPERSQLFIRITGNDGGGYFSREPVTFARIQAVVAHLDRDHPLASKVFRSAFVGKSSNNAGFLACALRAEGLLIPLPDKPHQYLLASDWPTWIQACLAAPGASQPPQAVQASNVVTLVPSAEPASKKRPKGTRKASQEEAPPSDPAEADHVDPTEP